MGVPGIHIEPIFGPFGEKPGGPFFRTCYAGKREIGGGREWMMKKVPVFFIIPGQKPIIETP